MCATESNYLIRLLLKKCNNCGGFYRFLFPLLNNDMPKPLMLRFLVKSFVIYVEKCTTELEPTMELGLIGNLFLAESHSVTLGVCV